MPSTDPPLARVTTHRLVDVLRQLPEAELASLVKRLGIAIDEAKRIDVPSQVGRALIGLPELRDPSTLTGPTRELLHRIAEARGTLQVPALPAAVGPLVQRGIVYARATEAGGVELILPAALLLQLRTWEGEDPRGVRALLAQASAEVLGAIASHYLGRPATPPVALGLEAAWEVLSDPERLRADLESLAPLERKLLRAVEKVGGEVETEELLELEREPLRLRGATGATPTRRGVGFALERRGLLIPVHPNRHVVPTEVAALVGAARRAEREAQRREIASRVMGEDHEPRRARFAVDPVPLALALALLARESSQEVRPLVGTPRSLLARLAQRTGQDQARVALLVALSRALGLWDPSAVSTAAPPGALSPAGLGLALFSTWRRGGAWDEARPEGETLRIAIEARDPSPVGVIREMVLDALGELADGTWVPWEALSAYVRTDSRVSGLTRLLDRWASRAGVPVSRPEEVARRVALESLSALGVVDVGEPDEEGRLAGPTLRLTRRGRAWLRGVPDAPGEPTRFVDSQTLRIGGSGLVGDVLACAPFVEVAAVGPELDLVVTPQLVSQALSGGFDTDVMRERLAVLAEPPDAICRLLQQAGAVVGRAEYVETQGFLWVEDPDVRELLRTRRQTSDLFVDPSPPSGLLLVPGVDLDRLARRCRTVGVELLVGGAVYRTRSMMAPAGSSSGSLQAVAAPRRSSGVQRRRSSDGLPAAGRRRGG